MLETVVFRGQTDIFREQRKDALGQLSAVERDLRVQGPSVLLLSLELEFCSSAREVGVLASRSVASGT
jgi:hypothetical protein